LIETDSFASSAFCFFCFFFRSKLALFQSRISLQKASVKVRGPHPQSHHGRAFTWPVLKLRDKHRRGYFSLFINQDSWVSCEFCNNLCTCFFFSFQLKAKRSDCNSKATQARNDYLLTLAAANAHHDRYYHTDLLHCIQVFTVMWEKLHGSFPGLKSRSLRSF